MGQQVRDVMTPNPSTVDAARVMKQAGAGVVPVAENGLLTRMVTNRDMAIRVVAEGKNPASTTVGEAAPTNLVTVDPEQELRRGAALDRAAPVRRLPVLEEDGRLVGVLAKADAAREGDDTQTGQVVEEISN